jgi:serine/threonine protein kinase
MALVDKPKSKKRSSGSSLVRHVTLEPRRDSFDGIIDDDSKNIRSSRHSGEHHAGNIDLLQNMHGYSPMATSRRPTRLATGRPPVCSSPFVGSTRSGQKGRFSFGSECIETPLAKRGIADWSSHQKGRDWGVGRSCPEYILQELIRRFEDRYTSEGNELEKSFDAPDGNSPSSSIFESFKMPGAGARTSNLGFEYEADVGTGMRDVTSDPEEEEEEDEEEEEEEEDDFTEIKLAPRASGLVRQNSVGASLLSVLHLTGSAIYIDGEVGDEKRNRRRMGSLAKHRRVSLCAQMADSRKSLRPRKSSFAAIDREAVLLGRKSILPSKFGLKEDRLHEIVEDDSVVELCAVQQATSSMKILANVFSFLSEVELLMVTTPVCSFWADASAEAHANLMLVSVGCAGPDITDIDDDVDVEMEPTSIALAMERPWSYLVDRFPWACFLSEGAFKRVYKVWNSAVQAEEALSVMDVNVIEDTGNKHIVGAELAVSALLSSLVRRNICPNFVLTRQVFTSHHEPPAAHWGCADNKRPKGSSYVPGMELGKKPRLPPAKKQGRFQYMRMELCTGGDIEEFLKRQPDEIMPIDETRALLFQMAFSLHAAADRFSLKHYDVKLLNFFLQTFTNVDSNHTVLRYGLGSHVFSLRMPTSRALVAKLADYGTANVQAESNGQPVTIGHFTTLENTPPDYMILGDAACQGHGHDAFGLGLCMLHVFTGHAPYEEIMEEVYCPSGLKKKLKKIWEDEGSSGYDVIRSVILADVEKDEDGVAVEGEPDETFYHTFYRYLVLFGIPADKFQIKNYGRVWRAVSSSIESCSTAKKGYGRSAAAKKCCPDATQFANDQWKYSLSSGSNEYIARARRRLESMEGGLELLISLVNFDPEKRATATDVLNSSFMAPLREGYPGASIQEDDYVLSYMAYATTL